MTSSEPTISNKAGGCLILKEDSLVIGGAGNEVVIPRKNVYGASSKGCTLVIRIVKMPSNGVTISAKTGLPQKGKPWYESVSWSAQQMVLDDEGTTRLWKAKVKEWACPRKLNIHVIANPHSGHGRGDKIRQSVQKHVAFTRHKISVSMTKGKGDAISMAAGLVLDENSIVAAIGGDGTMCEAIEGLMQRPDAEKGKFTISYIPSGSANAMAHMTGVGDDITAIWGLVKGETRPMDLFSFHQTNRVRYGVLSVTTGLIADIDIDSEVCRCCGPVRFTIYTIMKLFCCCCCCCTCPKHHSTTYPMKIKWLPVDGPAEDIQRPLSAPKYDPNDASLGWETHEGTVQFFQATSAPALDQATKIMPQARLADGMLHASWSSPISRFGLVSEFDAFEEGIHAEDNNRWTEIKAKAIYAEMPRSRDKVVLDGEDCEPGKTWQSEIYPSFLNVVVGTGMLPAFNTK
eukprot:TRINITY_DN21527_c0_g1_i1.p1 TRINITY_DN21527_c0_g1~~TRINITY_DN21527_c0_g1_i1.p1  ORF type:complete len:471 (+),score=84.78 TRINITY_DN21527_c0_g1_i1:39-1415(+)